MRFLCLALAILIAPLGLHAQAASDTASLPADIELVLTGGKWTSPDGPSGNYRAVLRTAGYEHITSSLTIDWVAETTDSTDSRVVASRLLRELGPGVLRLAQPHFYRSDGTWFVQVKSYNSHCTPVQEEIWRVDLGGPGEVQARQPTIVVRGCE